MPRLHLNINCSAAVSAAPMYSTAICDLCRVWRCNWITRYAEGGMATGHCRPYSGVTGGDYGDSQLSSSKPNISQISQTLLTYLGMNGLADNDLFHQMTRRMVNDVWRGRLTVASMIRVKTVTVGWKHVYSSSLLNWYSLLLGIVSDINIPCRMTNSR